MLPEEKLQFAAAFCMGEPKASFRWGNFTRRAIFPLVVLFPWGIRECLTHNYVAMAVAIA
jgi:hypothetical protein